MVFNAYLGISSLNEAKNSSLTVGKNILIEQIKVFSIEQVKSKKSELEQFFKSVEDDLNTLGNAAQMYFENEKVLNTKEYWDANTQLIHHKNNRLSVVPNNESSLFTPIHMKVNKEVIKNIEISAFLNMHFKSIFERNKDTVATYFIGKEGYIRYYPPFDMLKEVPSTFNIIDDIGYTPALPKNNPYRELKWTALYEDTAGKGLMITAVSPVYNKDTHMGAVAIDVTLKDILESYIQKNGYKKDLSQSSNYLSLLINNKNEAIAFNKALSSYIFQEKSFIKNKEVISKFTPSFKQFLENIKNKKNGFEKLVLNDKVLYLSYARLNKPEWLYVEIMEGSELFKSSETLNDKINEITNELVKSFSLTSLVFFTFLLILLSYIINKFLNPLEQLSQISKEIAVGNFNQEINIEANDEIAVLISNFKLMKNSIEKHQKQLNIFNKELQTKVHERTQELETTIFNLKKTQNQLIESEKMASLGGLVAGVAHEINTPIGIGITGITHLHEITQVIKRTYEVKSMSTEEFEEYIDTSLNLTETITINLKRTAGLVKSFKQIAVDQSSEEKRVFKIKEYFEEVVYSLNSIIKKTNIDICIHCNNDLKIKSHAGLYSQLITNLVINSIKHAFTANEKGRIDITVIAESDSLQIIYEDNGLGIKKSILPKIFDPFFTTNRDYGGTGLGLNIVYNIVTSQLNGSIKCASVEQEGVSFNILVAETIL